MKNKCHCQNVEAKITVESIQKKSDNCSICKEEMSWLMKILK